VVEGRLTMWVAGADEYSERSLGSWACCQAFMEGIGPPQVDIEVVDLHPRTESSSAARAAPEARTAHLFIVHDGIIDRKTRRSPHLGSTLER